MKGLVCIVVAVLMGATGCAAGESSSASSAGALVVNAYDASPLTIAPGEPSTLRWTVSGAATVAIDQGVGKVALTGSRVVTPAVTTTYTLVATDGAGKTAVATVEVAVLGASSSENELPVIGSFTANPSTMPTGASSTLTWEVANATQISIDQGVGPVASSGTLAVTPTTTTHYTLTATNTAGSVHCMAPVVVSGALSTARLPDLSVVDISKVESRDGYRVTCTIANRGEGPSPATIAKLYADDVYSCSSQVPSLTPGASVIVEFTSWTFSPVTPSIRVVVDADSAVLESDESNNEGQVTFDVETIMDLVVMGDWAEWASGDPGIAPVAAVSFGGEPYAMDGYVDWGVAVALEDGKRYAKVLQTYPRSQPHGWIAGLYPETTIPLGARFVAKVGFLAGSARTHGVTFEVQFWPSDEQLPIFLAETAATYDNRLDQIDISLAESAGTTGRVVLLVRTGASFSSDQAVWLDAKIMK